MRRLDLKTWFKLGFAVGLGWHCADQLVWLAFDVLRTFVGVALG